MLITLEKRLERPGYLSALVTTVSMIGAFLIGAILLLLLGANPITTYHAMFVGSLGNKGSVIDTLVKATPLMLTTLAVLAAFKMRFWNIGAEGQLAVGAIGASGVALFWAQSLPDPLIIPVMMVAAIAAAAIWGLVPALLKIWGISELLTTLMTNYIAILWVEHLYTGPWKDPKGFGFPGSAQFSDPAWLPYITGRLHIGVVFAVIAAFALWFFLSFTKWGYEVTVIGENPKTARYAGINIHRNILIIMLVSAGLAGLAGMTEVAGIAHRLQKGVTAGYGYQAIMIAWLAKLNPWAALFVSVLFAALLVGGDQLQITAGLPSSVALILQGTILLTVLGGEILTDYKVVIHRRATV